MKKTILKISLLFVALCMCVSLAACTSEIPELDVNVSIDSFSSDYDEASGTSNVRVAVMIENASPESDLEGFSYNLKFYDAEGSFLFSERVDYPSESLESGAYKMIDKEYTVAGRAEYAEAVPYSATVIPVDPEENESDSDSEGCSGDCSDGSWLTNLLLIGGGLYLAWKLFIED